MSTQPSLASDRVADPILTAVAQGYGGTFAPVANVLFPIVPVGARAGKIITFGPDDFVLMNTQRAPGESTKRVQFGHAGSPFALADHSLEASVPKERMQEAQKVPGIDLQTISIRRVQRIMDRERENQAAQLARDASKYATSNKSAPTGADKWDDPGSDPFQQVQDARLAVRSRIGVMPDVMELPAVVFEKLTVNAAVLARLGNADIKIATMDQLKMLFKINIVIGEEVTYDAATQKFTDIWGKDVILAATTPKSMQDMGSPAFGYTYQLEGLPEVEEGYYDNNTKTWYYPMSDAYQAVLTGINAGFLIAGAVS
jgi:hypothetical protein